METHEADLGIAGKPERLPDNVRFAKIGEIPLVLIAPSLPCAVRSMVTEAEPDWSTVPLSCLSTAHLVNVSNSGSVAIISITLSFMRRYQAMRQLCQWWLWDAVLP